MIEHNCLQQFAELMHGKVLVEEAHMQIAWKPVHHLESRVWIMGNVCNGLPSACKAQAVDFSQELTGVMSISLAECMPFDQLGKHFSLPLV